MDRRITPVVRLDEAEKTIPETSGKEVSVFSDSEKKLQEGLSQTLKRNETFTQNWQKKLEEAPKVFRCKGCMKTFKVKMLLGKHWKKNTTKCTKDSGFEMVADIQIKPDDVSTPEERERAAFLLKANKAAKDVAEKMNRERISSIDRSMRAEDLMKVPMIALERTLGMTPTEEIRRFVKMPFDRMNSSRLHMAEKELEKRG